MLPEDLLEIEKQRIPKNWVASTFIRSLILIHGSGTLGQEIINLKSALDSDGFNIDIHTIPFRLVSLIGVLIRAEREAARDDIARQIEVIVQNSSSLDRTTIVAHSYSTFLLTWWLNSQTIAKIRNVILVGSIARRSDIAMLTRIADQVIVDVVVSDKIPCFAEAIRPEKYEATGSFGTRGQVGIGKGKITTRFFNNKPNSANGRVSIWKYFKILAYGDGHSLHLDVDHFRTHVLPIAMDESIPTGTAHAATINHATVHFIRWAAIIFIPFLFLKL